MLPALVDDVEMHGVAAHFAEPADGRLAGAHGADRVAAHRRRAQLRPPRRSPRPSRAAIRARPCRRSACGVRHCRRPTAASRSAPRRTPDRRRTPRGRRRRASTHSTCRWMNSGAGGVETVELETLEQRELLQHHRTLRPDARSCRPCSGRSRRSAALRSSACQRAMSSPVSTPRWRRAAGVHDLLGAAEAVDRLGDEALRPGLARALDLRDRDRRRRSRPPRGCGDRSSASVVLVNSVPVAGTSPFGR